MTVLHVRGMWCSYLCHHCASMDAGINASNFAATGAGNITGTLTATAPSTDAGDITGTFAATAPSTGAGDITGT